jgi:hypothetical protein
MSKLVVINLNFIDSIVQENNSLPNLFLLKILYYGEIKMVKC